MADSVEIKYEGTEARIHEADVEAIAALRDVTTLREVWVDRIDLTPEILRLIAGLPQIAALGISGSRLTAEDFAILEALPPGAAVQVEDQEHHDPVWDTFRHRRANQATRLTPERRQEAANRYALGVSMFGFGGYDGGRTVQLKHGDAADEDLRLLRWLPQMEALNMHRCWGVTSASLRHLSGHPGLKTIDFNGPTFTGPLQLSRCPSLESFEFFPEDGSSPGDENFVGLDKMTGLRHLKGWQGHFTDPTLARIGRLKELRSLDLPLGELEGDDSLRHLAGLRHLEYLKLPTLTEFSDQCLKHLAGLTQLRFLNIAIWTGDGNGFRHLSGLKNLDFLTTGGDGVTDLAIKHLEGLTNLNVVQIESGPVTRKAVVALAQALPHVVIHWKERVFKSPQKSIRFRRHPMGEFASALIPERWDGCLVSPVPGSDEPPFIEWAEAGFTRIGVAGREPLCRSSPAMIRLWVEKLPTQPDATSFLRNCSRNIYSGRLPKRFETGLVKMASGGESESGMFPRDGLSCLTGVAILDGKGAAIQCGAPPSQFAGFRGLFAFVAASLRVGPEALFDEKVDVPIDKLK